VGADETGATGNQNAHGSSIGLFAVTQPR
jgi:hypothetical protein